MNVADHTSSIVGLNRVMSLATSALPNAPVVPYSPRVSLIERARRAVAATRRLISRPALPPALAEG